MGWLERLRRRWERGGRTGVRARDPELEERILSTPAGDEQAALLPEGERDSRHAEGHMPEQDERR
jgi:hypothetical protein